MEDFLQYLAFGGGAIATASFLLEYMTWFQNLKINTKKFVSFLVSAVLGAGAYAILTYAPVETIEMLTPWFKILSSIFGVYFLGQVYHKQTK